MKIKNKLLWIDKEQSYAGGNYIGMFDLLKGLAMLGIILSHCCGHYVDLIFYDGGENPLWRLFLSPLTILKYGYVPMLFMICGYGIRKQPVKKNIKNHLQMFIWPYLMVIVCVLACVLVKQAVNGGSIINRLWDDVLPFFLGFSPGWFRIGDFMGTIGPMWFFWTYIFGSIFLNFVLQEKKTWVQMILLGMAGIFAVEARNLILPFCIQQVVICAGFMYAGMHMKKGKVTQEPLPGYMVLLTYLLCVFCTEQGGAVEFSNNVYQLGVMDLLTSYIAGIVLLCLWQRLNVLQGMLADGLRWIGRHMLGICCFHTVTYRMLPWDKFAWKFVERRMTGILLEFVFSILIAVFMCILLEKLIKKIMNKKNRRGR